MVDFPVVPQRMALINVDLQNCFVEGHPVSAPDGRVVLERINRLADTCRRAGILVVHTMHVGVFSSEASALHRGLDVDASEVVLEKPRFGAFHRTGLESMLRERGIDTVIVSGIATNICCETTAREACVRDFRVFFLSDGTATHDIGDVPAAELQRATCTTLGYLFAQIVTVGEMIKKIEAV